MKNYKITQGNDTQITRDSIPLLAHADNPQEERKGKEINSIISCTV